MDTTMNMVSRRGTELTPLQEIFRLEIVSRVPPSSAVITVFEETVECSYVSIGDHPQPYPESLYDYFVACVMALRAIGVSPIDYHEMFMSIRYGTTKNIHDVANPTYDYTIIPNFAHELLADTLAGIYDVYKTYFAVTATNSATLDVFTFITSNESLSIDQKLAQVTKCDYSPATLAHPVPRSPAELDCFNAMFSEAYGIGVTHAAIIMMLAKVHTGTCYGICQVIADELCGNTSTRKVSLRAISDNVRIGQWRILDRVKMSRYCMMIEYYTSSDAPDVLARLFNALI